MAEDNLGSRVEWSLANPASSVAQDLVRELNISPILAQILAARQLLDPQLSNHS